nr:thioesterase family protein [Chiayiivirga flava]
MFRAPLSVRWRDHDAFDHVNNAQYLSYVEEARLRWLASLDGEWMSDAAAPVLAASQLNYRRPITWPAEIAVELFAERVGGSSLTLSHRIVSAADAAVLYCDGMTTLVWIDRASGRGSALPAVVRRACG